MSKKAASRPYKDGLYERLQDPEYASAYLSAAADDPESAAYLIALRNVAEARGMAQVAKAAGIPRESLYRALSPKGNPRWSTLAEIIKAMGLKIAMTPHARQSVKRSHAKTRSVARAA